MPRPDPRSPGDGQADLFGVTPVLPMVHGRHSQAVDRAMDAAAQKHLIEPEDEAMVTVVKAGAHALDAFEMQNKPYGPSKLIPAMTEALRELRMTPDSRQTETDNQLKDLFSGLANPTPGDAGAPVHHAEGPVT